MLLDSIRSDWIMQAEGSIDDEDIEFLLNPG
jgi:hypothetical protein